MRKSVLYVMTLTSVSMLYGCATPMDEMIDLPTKPMSEIYYGAAGSSMNGQLYDQRTVLRRPLVDGETQLSSFTRTEGSQLSTRFPRIENPELVMYVYPHLSETTGSPIPGYVTTFRMYETDHYALPGEVIVDQR